MEARPWIQAASRAVLIAAAVGGAACEVNLNSEGIVSRETKTFTITGTADIQLETFDGPIEIHSWDRDVVEVEIEKRAMEQDLIDEMRISAEQDGDRVVVKVTGPGRRDFGGIQVGIHFSPSATLRVALPRQSHVTAVSGDGSIVIEDVSGRLTLRTDDGSVRGARLGGEIHVRTADGSIRLDRIDGRLDLETDDGSIVLDDVRAAALRARTGDGSIRLRVDPDSTMSDDWDVQTGDGSVTLTLPAAFNGEIDAETRDGSVRTSHPNLEGETRAGDSREERRRTLRATLGAGGHTIRVRSGDGTIRIE